MSLTDITARIRAAEQAAGRPEGSVTLIAVSKVQPLDRVEAVLGGGIGFLARITCRKRRASGRR